MGAQVPVAEDWGTRSNPNCEAKRHQCKFNDQPGEYIKNGRSTFAAVSKYARL